jgi:transcriptional regulator with XRE-family HTH domain
MVHRREKEIGDLIAQFRVEAGLSQAQLVDLIDRSGGALGQWEKQRNRKTPTLENVDQVINALGLRVHEFFASGTSSVTGARLNGTEAEMLLTFRRLNGKEQRAYMAVLRSLLK